MRPRPVDVIVMWSGLRQLGCAVLGAVLAMAAWPPLLGRLLARSAAVGVGVGGAAARQAECAAGGDGRADAMGLAMAATVASLLVTEVAIQAAGLDDGSAAGPGPGPAGPAAGEVTSGAPPAAAAAA
eukprot:COSAG04_NODE_4251_length_2206_cov_5.284765_1_plen_126_part_10